MDSNPPIGSGGVAGRHRGTGELPPLELAKYLLDHPTVPDVAWTQEIRHRGEGRNEFIVRVLIEGSRERSILRAE